MRIERVLQPSVPAEKDRWLVGWYRVAEDDGSTVAYCPDIATARLIADCLRREKEGKVGKEKEKTEGGLIG